MGWVISLLMQKYKKINRRRGGETLRRFGLKTF
jgi:hypothetical protein